MDIQKNLNMDNQISINMEIQKSIKKKEKIPKKYKNFPDKRGSKKGDDDKQIKSPKNLKRKANEEENIASKKSKHDDKTENCDEKKDSIKRPETKMISVEVKKKENKKEEKLHEPSKKLEESLNCSVVLDTDKDIQSKLLNLQKNAESGKKDMNSSGHDLKRSGDISYFKNVAKKPKIGPKCMKRQDKDEVKDHKKSKFVIDHKAKVLKLNLSRLDKNLEANETDKEIDKEVTKKLEIINERRKEKSRPKHKEKSESESSKKGDDDKQIKSPKNLKRKANEEENIASKKSKHDDKTENCDEKKDSIKRPETKMISVEVKKKENKKEEKLHEPSKKLEESLKKVKEWRKGESVVVPIDPSQIKTEHPDIFDIDSLVHTINRNCEICPRKFNRSYRDIETEMIMTEITGSQTGSPVQKETVVNIKKEPNSSPIKGLMQMAMQKGLEDSDQWGNFSEFDIDSVVNVVNRRDEGRQLADCHVNIVKVEDQARQLADCHVNIVKIEDQGRQLEDGIVNFVNRENHGRELEDSNITIVKEEIQGRQLEEEAYLQMDDIEALVHYTNRKSHSVSPSKNNASQQPSLSA
ncbi:putative uncharacterized protein DDB_G0271982 [Mytilus californianus]|uniref:putative uncharacterized protein DDB_G0271982 n=1 Tax=Mytilus californianus TaxID=6549 RepID=UPI002245AAF6|nr:putative uncharacterized protein DDB_G0271982 [Mytilus californianus]